MKRHLIVNADDFGYSSGVSDGIMQAHVDGIVTSTSIMINMPDAARAIQNVKTKIPSLGMGLHINLTEGRPIASPDDVPSLISSSGEFLSRDAFMAALPHIDAEQANREIRAQAERFTALVGAHPDHLDSHHHATYLTPTVFEPMLAIATEYGIPIRNAIPRNRDTALELLMTDGARTKAEAWLDTVLRMTAAARVAAPDHFLIDFFGEQATLGDLLNLLLELEPGSTELMCHPALMDDMLATSSGYTTQRQVELRALTHPSVQELVESEGIELITFGDLQK